MDRRTWLKDGHLLDFEGERIWYRKDGAGPTLLFLHGYPTSSHDYAPVIEQLAPRYQCVSFDFLGFGASSKPRRSYEYALQHRVLRAVVQAAEVKRAVLVVHDYAVTLGQDFLAGTPKAPFALDGIVFLNGGLDPAQHRALPVQRFLASRWGRLVGPYLMHRKNSMRALRKIFVHPERIPEDDVWESIIDNGGIAVMPRLLHYMAERRARRSILVQALGEQSTPRAFVWGMDDPVSGKHVLQAIRLRAIGAEFHELHGIGHYPQLEAPEKVASIIERCAAAWTAADRSG